MLVAMDASLREELRTLRERAYAPRSTISHDPAAMERLRELEVQNADLRREKSGAALHPSEPAAAETPGDLSATEPVEATAAEERPPPAPPPTLPGSALRRGERWLWAVSIAAAAALSASITHSLLAMAPVTVSSGAPQIATLEPSALTDVPKGFFGAEAESSAFEYHGLTLFSSKGEALGHGATNCLMAVDSNELPVRSEFDENAWSFSGMMYSGCGAGAFPATLELLLDGDAPEPLRAALPEARAVQFVLDGERVGVFVDSGE